MDVEQQDVLVGTAVSSTTARGSRVGKKINGTTGTTACSGKILKKR